jgi:hypothetical protein
MQLIFRGRIANNTRATTRVAPTNAVITNFAGMATVETPYRASLQLIIGCRDAKFCVSTGVIYIIMCRWRIAAGSLDTAGATLVVALVLFAIITAMIAHTYVGTSEYHLPLPPPEDGELPPRPVGTPPKEGNERATTRVAPTNAVITNFAGMATVETPYRASLQLIIGCIDAKFCVYTGVIYIIMCRWRIAAGLLDTAGATDTVETRLIASLQLIIAVITVWLAPCAVNCIEP